MSDINPVACLSETLIESYASKLDYLCREYRETKDDLSSFLLEYYDKVGPSLASLHYCAHTARRYRESSACALGPLSPAGKKRSSALRIDSQILSQTRDLYLLLVRKLHPDQRGHSGDEEVLKEVTNAYREGRVGSLWKISFEQEWLEIRRLPQAIRQSLLSHYHRLLSDATRVMESDLRALLDSPEYRLQQRVFAARLRGEDLLSRIVEHLEQEASQQARRIEYRKMREQLMQEAVWNHAPLSFKRPASPALPR